MKEIKGDLIKLAKEGNFDFIIHGCNCFHTMGAGIASQIKKELPLAYMVDCTTKFGDKKKLGTYSIANIYDGDKEFCVINAYTQYKYNGKKPVDYDAIRKVFNTLSTKIWKGAKIGYPKIGCGLGGGDWEIVSKIIDEELKGHKHTLVKFKPLDLKQKDIQHRKEIRKRIKMIEDNLKIGDAVSREMKDDAHRRIAELKTEYRQSFKTEKEE